MPTLEQWRSTWNSLGGAVPEALYGRVIAAYGESHRRYHTPHHLDECFAVFAEARSQAEHPGEIELALWFHDAIYDTKRKDNEEKSAQWARAAMLEAGLAPDGADRVERLIMATCHDAVPQGEDAQLLVDVDLSILGAAPERFDEYERQVREEYSWVPEAIFRRERRKVLEAFLGRDTIYSTDHFRDTRERRARDNLQRSVEKLGGTRGARRDAMRRAGRTASGVFMLLVAAGFLGYAWFGGMPWWLAGLLVVVLVLLAAARFRAPEFVDEIQITDEGVTRCCGPKRGARQEERVSWSELTKVEIQTSNAGPFAEDFYFVLHGANGKGVAIANDVAFRHRLLDELQQRLPGLDDKAVIEAWGCTDNRSFLIWERKSGA